MLITPVIVPRQDMLCEFSHTKQKEQAAISHTHTHTHTHAYTHAEREREREREGRVGEEKVQHSNNKTAGPSCVINHRLQELNNTSLGWTQAPCSLLSNRT